MIDGAGVVVGMGVVEVVVSAPARATKEHSATSIEHRIFVFSGCPKVRQGPGDD